VGPSADQTRWSKDTPRFPGNQSRPCNLSPSHHPKLVIPPQLTVYVQNCVYTIIGIRQEVWDAQHDGQPGYERQDKRIFKVFLSFFFINALNLFHQPNAPYYTKILSAYLRYVSVQMYHLQGA
jgi:hypothetical protein